MDNISNVTNITNSSTPTECPYNYCVEATIYRKVLGSLIFLVVWPFIVQDVKFFPLGRPAAALLGATLMVVFTVTPQNQVFLILGDQGNIQTICLLLGMMALSYYYDREGLLHLVTLWIFGRGKPFRRVLWKVCILSAVLSALITNDATCVVITPLLLKEHIKQGRPKNEIAPLLLSIATSANIGSASTFFGNPQNAFIASKASLSLLIFFITSLPAAIIGLTINIGLLYLVFIKVMLTKQTVITQDQPVNAAEHEPELVASIAEERDQRSTLYDQSEDPCLSSEIAVERSNMLQHRGRVKNAQSSHIPFSNSWHGESNDTSLNHANGLRTQYGAAKLTRSSPNISEQRSKVDIVEEATRGEEVVQTKSIRQRSLKAKIFLLWLVVITTVMIGLLAVPPLKHVTFNLGLVPVGAAVFTMLTDTIVNRKYARDVMVQIDWPVLLMFFGIFVWIAGFQNTTFPQQAFEKMRKYMNLSTVWGVLLFTLFVIVGSNILSNVPLVILIIGELDTFTCGLDDCSQLVGVLLAWTSTIAGNFTLIGSIANLIVAEKARSCADYNLTFWGYLKFGFLSTLIVLFTGLPVVYFSAKHVRIST